MRKIAIISMLLTFSGVIIGWLQYSKSTQGGIITESKSQSGGITAEKVEINNAKSENQSGGITVGKIEKLIVTDKESLGIREPLGLYKDGKRVGMVVNPTINEAEKRFIFDRIDFNKPFMDNVSSSNEINLDYYDGPFEFKNYVIKVNSYKTLTRDAMYNVAGIITEVVQ